MQQPEFSFPNRRRSLRRPLRQAAPWGDAAYRWEPLGWRSVGRYHNQVIPSFLSPAIPHPTSLARLIHPQLDPPSLAAPSFPQPLFTIAIRQLTNPLSSFVGYQLNNNANGYVMPANSRFIGMSQTADYPFQAGIRTPGFFSIPVCDIKTVFDVTVTKQGNVGSKNRCSSYPCC